MQRLGGSLLSHGCGSAALLAGLPDDAVAAARSFGQHLGIAHEVRCDKFSGFVVERINAFIDMNGFCELY